MPASLSCIEMWPLLDDRRAYSGVLFVVQYIVPLMVLLTMYVVAQKRARQVSYYYTC